MSKSYRPRKPPTLNLPIQLDFEPNRLEQSYLQQAYAHLVPIQKRRLHPNRSAFDLEAQTSTVVLDQSVSFRGRGETG